MRVLSIHCRYLVPGGEDAVFRSETDLLRSHGVTVDTLLFDNRKNTAIKMLQLPFNIGAYRTVKRKISAFKPDIVHIHNLHFSGTLSVFYAVRHCGIPFTTTLHNYRFVCPSGTLFNNGRPFMDSVRPAFPWTAVRKGVYRRSKCLTLWMACTTRLHRALGTFRLCDRYIALSEEAKAIFLSAGVFRDPESIVVKGNFCEERPQLPDRAPSDQRFDRRQFGDYFLFAGRLSPEKGICHLLQAFARCGYTLLVAGDGELRNEVIRYSRRYPNITYMGLCEQEEILDLMGGCTALVFPSVWTEGMPRTILEALSCGVPVIASRIGVMKAMIRDGCNGLHFHPGDTDDLVATIHRWYHLDPDIKEVYRKNALSVFRQHYSAEGNYQQLSSIYASVLAVSPPVETTPAMQRISVMNFPVHTGKYEAFLVHILERARTRSSTYTCVANVHMLISAHLDYEMATILCNAGLVTPDGVPLTWAMKLLYGIRQERVAGMDLLTDLLSGAREKGISVYFYGGDEALLSRTARHMDQHYPGLSVAGYYSPPYRALTDRESDEIADDINASGAGLVFVVLGCPKQEKWMAAMSDRIDAVMVGIGGALPVLVGLRKRAPLWMQRSGFEWLFRLWQEPARLFRRYAITNSLFICLCAKAYLFRRIIGMTEAEWR